MTVQARKNDSIRTPAAVSDLRRAISRQAWLANRARNALRRPAFIGAISAGTFVTALVSMVVVPRANQAEAPVIPIAPRPDTLSLVGGIALSQVRLVEAESALAVARDAADQAAAQVAAAHAALLSDSLSADGAIRDSLRARISRLDALLSRAEQAPLPTSYRALAALPELRSDGRMHALLDSLTDIERERESVGAVGGVDPIFVALTAQASDIGRAIQAIARERRGALAAELGARTPSPPAVTEVASVDTAALVTQLDSIRLAMNQTGEELVRRRATALELDLEEERARERANAVPPPLALLTAAFVLSAVIGFAVAFFGELRRPRVSNPNELERFLGIRVLATVEAPMPSVDRGRRQADRSAPPYFDPGAEGYQLSYLGLATEHPTLLMTTVTGDDPAIAAVIACNLAAVAADEARNTLVLDLEPSCSASCALRARIQPGMSDLFSGDVAWPDVTVSARVGRDKSVDLVPCGTGPLPAADQLAARLREDSVRLARYYDAIFLLIAAADLSAGLPAALPSPDVIYCAQPGITPLRQLRAQLERLRDAGASVRGIVLWDAERPLLPTPRELTARSRRRAREPQRVAAAAT